MSPSADSPDDKPKRSADKNAERPADERAEQSGDQPDEQSAEQPDEHPAEQTGEQPAEQTAEHPAEQTAEQPTEKSAPKLAKKSSEKRAERPADAPTIGSLAEQFRVIGELRGPTGMRRYVAMRNDDHGEVVIDVYKSAADGTNDLAHLASDVQLRNTMRHPRVPIVLEGSWIDKNTYAFVSERIKGDTLQERLDRGDRPGTAEVATILNDVKAVLDWARAGGIVHRGVTPDSIVVEHDTNRMLVSLGLTTIPLAGLPGEVADTRTLGALAWSLFTGKRFVNDDSRPPLSELCPNLATRVVDSIDRVLRAKPGDRTPDASAFIGIVAVGDVLKQAEVEFAALDEEFASHFTGDTPRPGAAASPERLLRTPGTRESVIALGTVAALVLLIALAVGLAGRVHRANAPIVAQQMPTVPAAGVVDSSVVTRRNDSMLTNPAHAASGTVTDSLARSQDSTLRDNALRDSVLRDSLTRQRLAAARRTHDIAERDSLDHVNSRRDSLDENAYRGDSVRNAIRAEAQRDSVRRDSIRQALVRSDSVRIDSLRNDALRQDSVRREMARRDSIRRDSVRRDTIKPRPDSVRPDSIRPDTIGNTHDPRRRGG